MSEVIVVGGGPAGLMAADVVSAAGATVTLADRMPSLGRKLLMAGRGGLNLTHSEPIDAFLGRYGSARGFLEAAIRHYPPEAVRQLAADLGQPTFVGSSGRVFPLAMKASPLLRAWLARLAGSGVRVLARHTLVGLERGPAVLLASGDGRRVRHEAAAVVLALGGASWPRLGSDGSWVGLLEGLGVAVSPLLPANAGVLVAWSEHFKGRFAGEPLKRIAVSIDGLQARGEAIVTATGLEGGVVYALGPAVRAALGRDGRAALGIDLRPDLDHAALAARLARPRGKQSLSSFLRKAAGLSPVAIGLLRECVGPGMGAGLGAETLAALIKGVSVAVHGSAGLTRAISTAGGVDLGEVGPDMMLRRLPGVFVAGEMLDWEAPTGGYLLQAALATGRAAGLGALAHLEAKRSPLAAAALPTG